MKECFECGATKDIQEHHVVPRSRGGTKTVPLCHSCHMKAHGRSSKGMNHKKLTKEGLRKAKLKGAKLGTDNPAVREAVLKANRERGAKTLKRVSPHFIKIRDKGIYKGREIAEALNEMGVRSPSGKTWTRFMAAQMMKRVLASIENNKEDK